MAKIDGRIDPSMQDMHARFTQKNSDLGNKISEKEALELINRAEQLNSSGTSSFFRDKKEKNAGNKQLIQLLVKHRADFSEGSSSLIEKYLSTGKIPKLPQVRNNMALNPDVRGAGNANPAVVIRSHEIASDHRPSITYADRRDSSAHVTSNAFGSSATIENRRPSTTINVPTAHLVPEGGGNNPSLIPNTGNVVPPLRTSTSNVDNRHMSTTVPANMVGITGMGGNPSVISPPSIPGMGNPLPSSGPSNVMPPARPEATIPNAPLVGGNPPSSNTVVSGGGAVTPPITPPVHDSPGTIAPTPIAPTPSDVGIVSPHGKIIRDWHANKRTSAWHWFPMQERSGPGGDRMNNLYAKGGCLDKLDQVNGGKSRDYEFTHNRKAYTDSADYSWWGHCNNACEAACLLQAPKHDVVMTGKNGEKVVFTVHDIKGLLLKVTPSLIKRTDFKGERYNTSRDNPDDPVPELFLSTILEWTDAASPSLPFAMDIDRLAQVWNFPYDQVKIAESDTSPSNYKPTNLAPNGNLKFYHVEMSGTGFADKRRVYEFYIQSDSAGKALASGWIKTPNTHNNPDFLWRPHPIDGLMNKANWNTRSKSNPEVDPQLVYDIYTKSLV